MPAVSSALSSLDRLDRVARLDAPVQRVDPRVKVVTTLVFVVCVVSSGAHEVAGLLPFALFPIVLATAGLVPLGLLGRLLLLVSPFALVVGAFNPLLDREVVVYLGDVGISGGWVSYASIVLRFLLTSSAVLLLAATTSFDGICLALGKLRAPRVFVTQLLLLFRYLFVLGDEAARMAQARRLRSFGRRGGGLRVFGQMLGQLLLRAVARARRIHLAMSARGFSGEMPSPRELRLRPTDLAFLAGWSTAFIVFRSVDVPSLLGRLVTGAS